jgi:hypothetical protein
MPTRPRGGPTARRFTLAHAIVAAVIITAGIGFLTLQLVKDRSANVARAKAWNIQGPPCPALTQADWAAKHYEAKKAMEYGGAVIGRAAGDADCSEVHENGGKGLGIDLVCQFTSPAALSVSSKAGTFFFTPGIGQPATLIIHHDTPRCVMASKFTLQSE